MSDKIFVGFVEDYEKFQEQKGVEAAGASEDKDIRRIAYDNMDPISDDDLKILKTTITRHDPHTVYMQSRIDLYDDFYHDDPDSYETILAEVKKIRRVYVNYQEFLNALDLRDRYLESIVEKYGGESVFNVYYNSGLITDWIPPEPQLSKRSKEYARYIHGDALSAEGEIDYDRFKEMMDIYVEEMGIDVESIGVVGGVVTSPVVLKNVDYGTRVTTSTKGANINGVSASDLNSLHAMFRQWYHEDNDIPKKNDDESEWFCNTPEAIKAKYYTQPLVYVDQKFGEPESDEEVFDPNEMVIDPELNRPMTRSEYEKRKFVRMLRDSGWSELRMMRYLGVGSKYEQKLMFQKQKNRKRAKKKAASLLQSVMGEDLSGLEIFDSTDQLRGVLFDD